jgi:hypothetical protein
MNCLEDSRFRERYPSEYHQANHVRLPWLAFDYGNYIVKIAVPSVFFAGILAC